jgi:ATP-dependent Clp protease ATP-binding subunit ClpA
MSMWEPFTERARRAVVLAYEEAQGRHRVMLEIEDLLLGIIAVADSAPAQVLGTHGVTIEKARQVVGDAPTAQAAQLPKLEPLSEMLFSPNAKRSIEAAFSEARALNHNYIGPEHLLLGILRVNETEQSAAVTRICGESAQLRKEIVHAVRQSTPARSRSEAATELASTYEPFTEDARKSVAEAQAIAGSRNLTYIGSEHLLLGIWRVGKGSGYETLQEAGLSTERLEAAVDQVSPKGSTPSTEMEFTTQAKQTIEAAFQAALQLKQPFIASGHLLLGVIADKETGGRIFQALALNTEALQKDAIARLQQL